MAMAIELTTSPDAVSQALVVGGGGNVQPKDVRSAPMKANIDKVPNERSNDGLKSRISKFEHEGVVWSVCFSANGKSVATGSKDFFLRVFDVGSGKETLKINHGDMVMSVSFSPDGKSVATGSSDLNLLRVFDVSSGKEIFKSIRHGAGIMSVCFSSDGKSVATGSVDNFMRVFDVGSGKEILKPIEHGDSLYSVCFSPDGKSVATGSKDFFLRVFDVGSGKEILKGIKHGGSVVSVCFSPDGKSIATGSGNKILRVFDVSSGEETLKSIEHGSTITSVCFSPDGKSVATGSWDKFLRVFDVGSGKEILKPIEHGGFVSSVCYSPDGKSVATGSSDKFLHVFHVGIGEEILKSIDHGSATINCVCFSPDGKSVATGSMDQCLRVFDVGSGKEILKSIKHGERVTSVCYSPDGKRIATGSWDQFVHFFDVGSGEEILKPINHGCWIYSVCFSPDGNSIATGSYDKCLRIFDVSSGKEISKRIVHGGEVKSVCFSPDGKSAVTASHDGFVRVFDVGSGKETIKRISIRHPFNVASVCFSPDGKSIATGSGDKILRIFDVSSGEETLKSIEHGSTITSVCFSPDGKSVATGTFDDKIARVFSIANHNRSQNAALKPVMCFSAQCISISSQFSIAFSNGCQLQLLPGSPIFSSDSCLPLSPSIVLLWSRLSQDVQTQCFFTDSEVLLSEFWASEGGGLVSLASKWRNPDFPHALPTLKRLFEGEEPVFKAGLILRELLNCEKPAEGGHTIAGSTILPDSAVVEALLGNVSRHAIFAIHDSLLTQQLARAACIPSIQSIIGEFWSEFVELVPSCPAVAHNVDQVSFSESRRMYVAASESTSESVFESHFKTRPQAKGPVLDFVHFFVPFLNASAHRDAGSVDGSTISLMQALVETDNIDIFGTVTVRAIVQYKWDNFGLSLWLKEFCIYCMGLTFLVALSILDWQNWGVQPDDRNVVPPAILSALFCAVLLRSLHRETKQFIYSIPDGDGTLLRRILRSEMFEDFWQWLKLLHMTLGISTVVLVWLHSAKALPVLAITSFLRWWGTLFYLQVRCIPCVDIS
jgi:WD40 repeat protein